MLKVAVLSNVASGGNKKGLAEFRKVIASYPNILHQEVKTETEIAAAISFFKKSQIDCLVINGGDGTIQAALTHWLTGTSANDLPRLAILRSGTSSLVARNIGLKNQPKHALTRIAAWAQGKQNLGQRRKAVIKIEFPDDKSPVYGLFMGAAGVVQGIEYFHQHLNRKHLRGALLPGLTFARLMFSHLLGLNSGPLTPIQISYKTDNMTETISVDSIYIMVTSLDKLFWGARLYWGDQKKPLHFTHIRPTPKRFSLMLPALLCGRHNANLKLENGYFSENVESIAITLPGKLILDGEVFEYSHCELPVKISVGAYFDFLTDYQ